MAAMPILLAIVSQGSDTGPLWSSCLDILGVLKGQTSNIRDQSDTVNDLIPFIGHCDLQFMVQ